MYDIVNVYLENGLQVVLHRIPDIRTMACGLWIRQGSKDEDDSTNGLSHLIEHLKLNKENNSNPNFKYLLDEIVSEGVTYNAGTTKESTYFYFAGLVNTLEKCISALYHIATNDEFDEEFFINEKKVVNQEVSSFYSAFNQIQERTGQALWGNVGIGKIIVGNKENVDNTDINTIKNIINNSYTQENSVVVIVGCILEIIPLHLRSKVNMIFVNLFQNKNKINLFHLYKKSIESGYQYFDTVNKYYTCETCNINGITIEPNCRVTACSIAAINNRYSDS